MRKIFTLTIITLACIMHLSAQIPGYFEVRVTDMPGSATNRAIVEARAINTIIPQVTECDPDTEEPINNIIGGMKFALVWDAASGVTNVNIGSNNAPAFCPEPDANPAAGEYSLTPTSLPQQSGNQIGRAYFMNQLSIVCPDNWVLDQWITICTLNILPSTLGCTNCNMLQIYVEGTNPDLEDLLGDVGHTFAFDPEGSGFAPEYDMAPVNAPLPLNLVSFSAEKLGTNDALLEWTTVNEENTSHFTLQRSYNKEMWFNVGEVKAAGYSTEIKNYNFTDYQVYNGRDARLQVYYRLNMIDIDGRQRYSPIQSVVFGNGLATTREFAVFPNPASDGVHVEWDAHQVDQPTAIELYDVAGKLILSVPVSDQTNQQYIDFNPTRIQSGLYLMRIMHNDEAIEHKQIVVGRTN